MAEGLDSLEIKEVSLPGQIPALDTAYSLECQAWKEPGF